MSGGKPIDRYLELLREELALGDDLRSPTWHKDELDSKEHTREQLPSPEDDDRPVRVDLRAGTIHIRKPPPSP